ncbi:MAG: hypothetical protein EP334_10205 [Gammaproteobacteria bacterium]|nr:MAG: hypothetical protein EP334_10205 [Gammaproteobacteria bacterium]
MTRGAKMSKEAIQKCVDLAGGQTALAELMKPHLPPHLASSFRQGHLWGWLNRERISPVPPSDYVPAMSLAVGGAVPKHEIRPDIFAAPGDQDAA